METQIKRHTLSGFRRHDLTRLLDGNANLGVELGVAEGIFSERMMQSGRFNRFYGIDMYADIHDVAEYKCALQRMRSFEGYHLLRMRFDEALDLFDDSSLDFVYVDGYAHGGEEGGETIFAWAKKVKIGGVIAGDDYHPRWPLVCRAVDEFVRQMDATLMLTEIVEPDNGYCQFPSWAVVKHAEVALKAPSQLVALGKSENRRVAEERSKQRMSHALSKLTRMIA